MSRVSKGENAGDETTEIEGSQIIRKVHRGNWLFSELKSKTVRSFEKRCEMIFFFIFNLASRYRRQTCKANMVAARQLGGSYRNSGITDGGLNHYDGGGSKENCTDSEYTTKNLMMD